MPLSDPDVATGSAQHMTAAEKILLPREVLARLLIPMVVAKMPPLMRLTLTGLKLPTLTFTSDDTPFFLDAAWLNEGRCHQ